MKKEPLISIIVPVYNVENYLNKCIESIINQTFKNLDIILVNDGSTDLSGKICDYYALKDSRIRVIHKENGGLSDARNFGIEASKGEYLSFIDSDDFVSEYFIEWLFKIMIDSNADISSVTNGSNFWEDEYQMVSFTNKCEDVSLEILSPNKYIEYMLYQRIITGIPWRMYKRNIFDDIRFPKGFLYEDIATSYKLILKANKVVVTSAVIYAYRIRKNSIIRREFSEDKMIIIHIVDTLFCDICNYDIHLKKAAASRAFASVCSVFLQVPQWDTEHQDILWESIKKYRGFVITDTNRLIRRKNKFAAVISLAGKSALYSLGRKYGSKKFL